MEKTGHTLHLRGGTGIPWAGTHKPYADTKKGKCCIGWAVISISNVIVCVLGKEATLVNHNS